MIQWMLAIWSLVPLPFLKPAWKFTVHVLLKSDLENFEHYFTSMWDECNCQVVWAFFGIAFPREGNENWTFSSPAATAEFSKFADILSAALSQHSSFRILNSSPEIPSLPLALFIGILPKAHLTSHSRMSSSRWVFTPSWISGSWRSFLYSSSRTCLFLASPKLVDVVVHSGSGAGRNLHGLLSESLPLGGRCWLGSFWDYLATGGLKNVFSRA